VSNVNGDTIGNKLANNDPAWLVSVVKDTEREKEREWVKYGYNL
jgi:hypothetical protein